MKILGPLDPQPPMAIRYMLGAETWLPAEQRSPRRLHVEEWGNLGPLELDPGIKPNPAGFRCRSLDYLAPPGAMGVTTVDGVLCWTDVDEYGRTASEREATHRERSTHHGNDQ